MLVIDVGNSRTKSAVFENETIERRKVFDTGELKNIEFLRDNVLSDAHHGCIAFSSVVPEIGSALIRLAKTIGIECFNISLAKNKVLKINYNIEQLGGDRLANAVAAYRCYGGPCLVIDFGTATTYNSVLADGTFDGGIIAPGIKTCIEFLIEHSGLLSGIPLKHPQIFMGHTSEEALVSGYYYTFIGQVKEIMENLKRSLDSDYLTIGTGGLVDFAAQVFPQIVSDKDLTFVGIKMIYDENRR